MTADVNDLGVVHESVGKGKTVDGYFINGEFLFGRQDVFFNLLIFLNQIKWHISLYHATVILFVSLDNRIRVEERHVILRDRNSM